MEALLLLWLICGVVCAVIAANKHRSAFGWFILGCLLGVIALIIIIALSDARPPQPQTIIIQQSAAGQPGYGYVPAPPAGPVDTSRWSKADRAAHEARMHSMAEPRVIEATPRRPASAPPLAAPSRHYRELEPAIVALKGLAEAGGNGLDDAAAEAIMDYLEVENGDDDYGRREARDIIAWARALPADGDALRTAAQALKDTVGSRRAFLAAVDAIAGTNPTDMQDRWRSALRRTLT